MTKKAGNIAGFNIDQGPIPGAITMMQDEYYFLLEQAFTQSQRFVFNAAEVKYFLLDPTNYTPGPTQEQGVIIFRIPSIAAEAGPIEIDFYSGPTLGAAVATPLTLPPFNRVAGSAITAQLELSTLNQAPDVLGTPLSELLNPASATGAGFKSGTALTEQLPFRFDLATPLLMVLTNQNGADTDVGIRHGWFEI